MRRRRKTHKRGRTRPGRMALLDALFANAQLALPSQGLAVDLGYGDAPTTCVEWASALKAHSPELTVVGVEVENARVEAARRLCDEIEFRQGGFELLSCPEPVAAIRCMNVLRGYGLEQAMVARDLMLSRLAAGGLLIEGTSDTEGHLLAAHFWRAPSDGEKHYEGLLLATDFSRGFAPRMFRDVLPRDLRRHVFPGEPVFEFLEHFERLTNATRQAELSLDAVFARAVELLSQERDDVHALRPKGAQAGYVLWTPERPSPRG